MRRNTCPVPTCLGSITAITCPEDFGQIQKLIFWRSGNSIATDVLVKTQSTWTTLKAAADSTKAVVTPFLSGLTTEIGKAKEFGSGNDVRNGIPIVVGSDPTKVTVKLYEYPQQTIRDLKALMSESLLEVILVNENGWFGMRKTAAGVINYGFPIQSFFVSDKNLGGFDQPDHNELSFQLPANWSDYFTVIDPTANFSALDL